jgi:hypothetical protein
MATHTLRKSRQRNAAGRLAGAEAEVQALKPLPIAQLRTLWAERHDGKCPLIRSREILLRMLAWDMQTDVLGGLDARTGQKLMQIADTLDSGRTYEAAVKREVGTGAVLTREWRGVVHTAVITAKGVEYEGKIYRSLSDVARTITGTRWSGPRFFGLDQRPTKKQTSLSSGEIAA